LPWCRRVQLRRCSGAISHIQQTHAGGMNSFSSCVDGWCLLQASLVVNELPVLDQLFGELFSTYLLKDADASLEQAELPIGRVPLDQRAAGFHDQAMDLRVYRPSNFQAAVAQADAPDVRSLLAAVV
jgi:hypothetical protein